MKIFSNYTLKSLKLVNRIVMAPMCTQYNIISDKAVDYYSKRAKGGAGKNHDIRVCESLLQDNKTI